MEELYSIWTGWLGAGLERVGYHRSGLRISRLTRQALKGPPDSRGDG